MKTRLIITVVLAFGCSGASDPELCADCDTSEYAEEREYCASVINDFRKQAGREELGRASELEECATAAAVADAASGQAHGYFIESRGCNGTVFAENEIPGWPLERYDDVRSIVLEGAQVMYDEGPGGGHHDNMVNESYTEVGCGIHVTDAGGVWVVHNFR